MGIKGVEEIMKERLRYRSSEYMMVGRQMILSGFSF